MLLALTHVPSPQMHRGQRTYVPHEPIEHARAVAQHEAYCDALRRCGASVERLSVRAELPDSVFIEDTAVVFDELAILAAMGTGARRDEPAGIEPVLRTYRAVRRIEPPATLEGGDVLRVGRTLLVGRSPRTNPDGIRQLAELVRPLNFEVRAVAVRGCLHLKTACTALPDGRLLVNPAWLAPQAVDDFDQLAVPAEEPWAANVLSIGQRVVLAAEHPRTAAMLADAGFSLVTTPLSEFGLAEGGATCLSLLLNGSSG